MSSNHKPHVRLLTRAGCHLCDDARVAIDRAGRQELYTFEAIDIDTDPDLIRRFGWDIPVVLIDDVMVFKHKLSVEDFSLAIEKATTR